MRKDFQTNTIANKETWPFPPVEIKTCEGWPEKQAPWPFPTGPKPEPVVDGSKLPPITGYFNKRSALDIFTQDAHPDAAFIKTLAGYDPEFQDKPKTLVEMLKDSYACGGKQEKDPNGKSLNSSGAKGDAGSQGIQGAQGVQGPAGISAAS